MVFVIKLTNRWQKKARALHVRPSPDPARPKVTAVRGRRDTEWCPDVRARGPSPCWAQEACCGADHPEPHEPAPELPAPDHQWLPCPSLDLGEGEGTQWRASLWTSPPTRDQALAVLGSCPNVSVTVSAGNRWHVQTSFWKAFGKATVDRSKNRSKNQRGRWHPGNKGRPGSPRPSVGSPRGLHLVYDDTCCRRTFFS
jgi:hypothetical protein